MDVDDDTLEMDVRNVYYSLLSQYPELKYTYDLQVEQSDNLTSSCLGVRLVADTPDYTVAVADYAGGHSVTLCVSNRTAGTGERHSVETPEGRFEWTGPYDVKMK